MIFQLDNINWEALALKHHGNVEDMCGATMISRKSLERYFLEKWQVTPHQWAKKVVLEKALQLIREGYSNKAVVHDLHLCSESWLCRELKRVYGASPQKLRMPGYR